MFDKNIEKAEDVAIEAERELEICFDLMIEREERKDKQSETDLLRLELQTMVAPEMNEDINLMENINKECLKITFEEAVQATTS